MVSHWKALRLSVISSHPHFRMMSSDHFSYLDQHTCVICRSSSLIRASFYQHYTEINSDCVLMKFTNGLNGKQSLMLYKVLFTEISLSLSSDDQRSVRWQYPLWCCQFNERDHWTRVSALWEWLRVTISSLLFWMSWDADQIFSNFQRQQLQAMKMFSSRW